MKEFSRSRIWNIWQTGKQGGELEGEEARLYQVLTEHPEHADLWDHLDQAIDEDIMVDGANMELHVVVHTMIENQLAENNPPAAGQVLRVLMQKGLTRHEAVHALAYALVDEISRIQRDRRPYDERHYLRELRKLPSRAMDWHQKKK